VLDLDDGLDVLTEQEQAEQRALDAFLAGGTPCIVCGAAIEPALARMGSTTCSLHRPVNAPS
jgi:hypothetical protein